MTQNSLQNNTEVLHVTKMKRARHVKSFRAEKAIANPSIIQRELNNRSFFNFFKYFWSEVSNDDLILNWHIEYLCNELQLIGDRVGNNLPKLYDLIINISPGSTKTVIVSIMFPAWLWTRYFHLRFITASYSSALSLESAEYSRELIRSDKFKRIYPELEIKHDKDQKSNFKIVKRIWNGIHSTLKQGGNRYSTSTGGTLTGFHGHLLIVDDPLNPEQAASDVELLKANRWVTQTLSMRKTNKAIVPTILVMQRLHENDVSGAMLIRKKETTKHICIPAELGQYAANVKPPHLKKFYINNLFDPIRMNRAVLKEAEQDLGQYGYAGQMGQNPTPPGGGMFKVENFNVVDTYPITEVVMTARYWDKAGTQGGGAYTVGVKICKLKTGQFVVLDVKRGQWDALVRERTIRKVAEADGTGCFVYYEQEPGSGGKESAQYTTRNLAGFMAYPDRPIGNKAFRADPFSVQVNDGNVMIMRAPWNNDFVKEFEYFPLGKYKDQVDAASACFAKLNGKKIARVVKR